jgi:hypothetical protein
MNTTGGEENLVPYKEAAKELGTVLAVCLT